MFLYPSIIRVFQLDFLNHVFICILAKTAVLLLCIACIVLSCHQQKCQIFVNFDKSNLFDILLLLFTFLIFNLLFSHFFVIFHIFLGKSTPTYFPAGKYIGPQDVPRTSPFNVSRTSAKDITWTSWGRPDLTSWGGPEMTSREVLIWRSRDLPGRLIWDVPKSFSALLTLHSNQTWMSQKNF